MSKFLLLIFVFYIITFINTSDIKPMIIPLSKSPNDPTGSFNVDHFIDSYSKFKFYGSLDMGSPKKSLTIFFDDDDFGFYIKREGCSIDSVYDPLISQTYWNENEDVKSQIMKDDQYISIFYAQDNINLKRTNENYFLPNKNKIQKIKSLENTEIKNISFIYIPGIKEYSKAEKDYLEKMQKYKEKEKNYYGRNHTTIVNGDSSKIPLIEKSEEKNKKEEKPKTYEDYQNWPSGKSDDEEPNNDPYNPYDPYSPYYEDPEPSEKGNEKENDNDDFYSEDHSICAYFGVQVAGALDGMSQGKKNLIYQLKKKNIINNYNWFMSFGNNNEGELIIGAAPHEVKPSNYLEKGLKKTNAIQVGGIFYWDLIFSKIYMVSKEDKTNFYEMNPSKKARLIFNENYISGPQEYYNLIKEKYFNNYIKKGICFEETHSRDKTKRVFYCGSSMSKEDIEKLPELNFKSTLLEYTFTLTHKDLLIPYHGRILFAVIFDETQDYWRFGQDFMSKYPFSFNQDSKTLSFYSEFVKDKNDDEGKKHIEEDKTQHQLPPSKRNEIYIKDNKIIEELPKSSKKVFIVILLIIFFLGIVYITWKKYIGKDKFTSDDLDYTKQKMVIPDSVKCSTDTPLEDNVNQ